MTLLKGRSPSDSSLLSSFAYTVDNVGNRLSITESVLGTDNTTYHNATVSYGYDNLYRLTSEHRVPANPSANNPAFWYEYHHDPAGNRLLLTQKDEAGNVIGTTASTYDAANKLLTAGNTSYTWDANGNQTGKTVNNATTTYIWDYEDKMVQLHDGVTMTFTTDADGFRRSLAKDGAVTYFLYDRRSNIPGLDPLIAEVNAAGNATARYVHANGLLALRHEPSAISHWYHFEAIGSTRQLTEGGEGVTDEYDYEAFGTTAATSGSTANPHKYVGNYGYYNDSHSGLMLLGARHYGGLLGRFLSLDPVQDGVNLYIYGLAAPGTWVDPTGMKPAARCKKAYCGPDITAHLKKALSAVEEAFNTWGVIQQAKACVLMCHPGRGWDIQELHMSSVVTPNCPTDDCAGTVRVDGKCFYDHTVNYVAFGLMKKLCSDTFNAGSVFVPPLPPDTWVHVNKCIRKGAGLDDQYWGWLAAAWAQAGFSLWHKGQAHSPAANVPNSKCGSCPDKYDGDLTVQWGPYKIPEEKKKPPPPKLQ